MGTIRILPAGKRIAASGRVVVEDREFAELDGQFVVTDDLQAAGALAAPREFAGPVARAVEEQVASAAGAAASATYTVVADVEVRSEPTFADAARTGRILPAGSRIVAVAKVI